MNKREQATFDLVVAALRVFASNELGQHIIAVLPDVTTKALGAEAGKTTEAKLKRLIESVDVALKAADRLEKLGDDDARSRH